MQVNLTTAKAKQQAKLLADYLASIERNIPHGNALDAVARMYGTKDWNVLAAALADPASEPAGETKPVLKSSGVSYTCLKAGQVAELEVAAQAFAPDKYKGASFDAADWLYEAPEKLVLQLQDYWWEDGGNSGQSVRELADFYCKSTGTPATSVGTVTLAKGDTLAFCRAFRYPLFVKLMLLEQYGDFDAVNEIGGIDVMPDADQPGRWAFRAGAEGSDISYDTEDEAFAALGQSLEEGFREFMPRATFFDIEPGSGKVVRGALAPASDAVPGRYPKYVSDLDKAVALVLKQGQVPLSKKELRRITNDGEFYLHVAVPVDLETMTGIGIEWLNDVTSEAITGDSSGLSDISYERYAPPNEAELIDTKKMVLMLVTAAWEPWDSMYDENEDEEGDESDSSGT